MSLPPVYLRAQKLDFLTEKSLLQGDREIIDACLGRGVTQVTSQEPRDHAPPPHQKQQCSYGTSVFCMPSLQGSKAMCLLPLFPYIQEFLCHTHLFMAHSGRLTSCKDGGWGLVAMVFIDCVCVCLIVLL